MTSEPLLTREEFVRRVFARDGHACVVCGAHASDGVRLDAHHIIERRLFPDQGYYLSNGATLCDRGQEGCHWKAESTLISVEDLRRLCGIKARIVPPNMYADLEHTYDKWGNLVLPSGQRTRGPLFEDGSVQKVLAPVLHLFTDRVKYPRTYHLPFSPGATEDDRVLPDCSVFEGREVVVTRKMDGENTTCYPDAGLHARSIDGRHHFTRTHAKRFWSERAHDLPPGWRLCGENLYQVHSLRYDNLPGYLLGFSIWNEANICLSWDETLEWFELLSVPCVPVLWRGVFDEAAIRALHRSPDDDDRHEGYVVRLADAFAYRDFHRAVAKFVRPGHVQTTRHWRQGWRDDPNGLAPSPDGLARVS